MSTIRSGMYSRIWPVFGALVAIVLLVQMVGCSKPHPPSVSGKLQVVTTLFPLYDFARCIAGDRSDVSLLLPPGVEPHSFEPRPEDIVRVGKAGLFIYTSPVMEPWAETLLKGIDRHSVRITEAGAKATYLNIADEGQGDDHERHGHAHSSNLDPHIWLDFGNDQIIVDNILAGFVAADPRNAEYYRANAAALKTRLTELDARYRRELASCATRTMLHGGHYAFGYLAHRYGLSYRSLSGISSESEPSGAKMAAMIRQIKASGVPYLFAEELLSPRMSETLANEAGVAVLRLHGAHNLGREEFKKGVTFFNLMATNLDNLKKGLECRSR